MPKAKTKAKALGQAPALSKKLWAKWLDWVKQTAGPRIYCVILFTGAFGLRCSEALALKHGDVCLASDVPKIRITGDTPGARKSPGDVYVRKQHLQMMRRIMKEGVSVSVTKGHKHGKGKRKTITKERTFRFPTAGFLFKSRKKASAGHLHYGAVYAHVRKQAPAFLRHLEARREACGPEVAKLRPHSGRATLITELMGEGLTTSLSMKYARHAPSSHKVHLGYGRLSLQDIKAACDGLASSRTLKKTQWSAMSMKELIAAQKAILRELEVRESSK
jgi:integrase